MRSILILIFSIYAVISYSQKGSKELYEKSFDEQLQMLQGKIPVSFKRAVFLSENPFYNDSLSYEKFCKDILIIAGKLKNLIKQRGLTQYKTAGNWAVFTYMTDTLPINDYKPCSYDFDDFMGEKDWASLFVTKLMKTKFGNCHSLPYFYKILCEELGAKASLALTPNHVYIKHIDEKGQWTNIELTNGSFPRDQWMIEQMGITVEAIKNETYMTPLSDKESIAMCMFDLASTYQNQNSYDTFMSTVVDSALNYFPKSIPLKQLKANCVRAEILKEEKRLIPDKETLKKKIKLYEEITADVDRLGYKEMPTELYKDWVKSFEEEKLRRANMSRK